MPKRKSSTITITPEFCTGCLRCALACSFFKSSEKTFNLSNSKIKVLPRYDLSRFEIAFGGDCDKCGICVQYCEFGALSRISGFRGKGSRRKNETPSAERMV